MITKRLFAVFALLISLGFSNLSHAQPVPSPEAQASQAIGDAMQALNDPTHKSWSIFQPREGDVSMMLIAGLLGGDPSGSGELLGHLGAAAKVFNLACMTLASLMFIVLTISGTIHTAVDGQLLGKKWSAAWVPLRVAFAIALLAPLASGYSLGQIVGLGAINAGVGVADNVWSAASSAFIDTHKKAMVNADKAKIDDFVANSLRAEMCVAAQNRLLRTQSESDIMRYGRTVNLKTGTIKWGQVPVDVSRLAQVGTVKRHAREGAVTRYDVTYNAPRDIERFGGECGIGSLPERKDVTTSERIENAATSVKNIYNSAKTFLGVGDAGETAIKTEVDKHIQELYRNAAAQKQIIAISVLDSMIPIAPGLVRPRVLRGEVDVGMTAKQQVYTLDDAWTPPSEAEVNRYVNELSEHLIGQATAAVDQVTRDSKLVNVTKTALKAGDDYGWALAGAWFFQIAKVDSALREIGSFNISANPSFDDSVAVSGQQASATLTDRADVDRILSARATQKGLTINQIQELGSTGLNQSFLSSMAQSLGMSNMIAGGVRGIGEFIGFDPENNNHPLVQLQASGTAMIGTSLAVMSATSAAGAVATAAESIGKVGASTGIGAVPGALLSAGASLAKSVFGKVEYFAGVLLVIGLVKAVFLPILPLFKWIKQVVFWLIAVAEMLVAIPLWLAFHMAPSGEGWTSDNAKAGYQILMEAALRPVLLVFALLLAYALIWPAMLFVNKIFMLTVITTGTEFELIGPIVMIAQAILYCIVIFYIIDACCDVIDILPPKVLQWVSVHVNGANSNYEGHVQAAFLAFRNEARGAMGATGKGKAKSQAGAATAAGSGDKATQKDRDI